MPGFSGVPAVIGLDPPAGPCTLSGRATGHHAFNPMIPLVRCRAPRRCIHAYRSTFRRGLVAAGLLLAGLSLHAQDVIVGAPQWSGPGDAPESPPALKGRLHPVFPPELRETDEIGYAVVRRYIDATGDGRHLSIVATQIPYQRAMERDLEYWELKPALRGGRPVDGAVWIPVIFNPARARAGGPDATPRLLSVTPVLLPWALAPKGEPPVVRVRLSLDETGTVVRAEPIGQPDEDLTNAVAAGVRQWRFAPARRNGQPVAAELEMGVIGEPKSGSRGGARVPPRLVHRVDPEYPYVMRRYRLEGRVQVDFEVDRDGRVQNPVIGESSNPAFDEPALVALRQWKFQPATVGGKPVRTRLREQMNFRMVGSGSDAFTISPGAMKKLPEEWRFDTAPKIRGVQIPIYPYALRAERVYGEAQATMLVDERGRVARVAITKSDRPEFGLALAAALEGFRFDPALRDSKPVKCVLAVEQRFNHRELPDDAGDWLLRDEQKHPERITAASQLDRPLMPVSRSNPIFPVTVAPSVTHGTATIECLVDREGHARLPRVVDASEPAFGYAAAQAVAAWWFEPPTAHGKPVVVRIRVPIEFNLK